jgi:hypothetical protein
MKLADDPWPHDLCIDCLIFKDKPFNLFGQFHFCTISKMREKLLQIEDESFFRT